MFGVCYVSVQGEREARRGKAYRIYIYAMLYIEECLDSFAFFSIGFQILG